MNEFDDEEQELSRLLAKARPLTDDAGDLQLVQNAVKAEQNPSENTLETARLAFEKWRVLHKYVYARPFALKKELKRSEQWRFVAQKIAPLGDRELNDWIDLQIDVANNRQDGISDLRIRRDGPCYLILLEYVGNRKRTALAVLHWATKDASPTYL